MRLTDAEVIAVADRLDEIIGDHFHDAVYDVILQRHGGNAYDHVSDGDIRRIKEELKLYL